MLLYNMFIEKLLLTLQAKYRIRWWSKILTKICPVVLTFPANVQSMCDIILRHCKMRFSPMSKKWGGQKNIFLSMEHWRWRWIYVQDGSLHLAGATDTLYNPSCNNNYSWNDIFGNCFVRKKTISNCLLQRLAPLLKQCSHLIVLYCISFRKKNQALVLFKFPLNAHKDTSPHPNRHTWARGVGRGGS